MQENKTEDDQYNDDKLFKIVQMSKYLKQNEKLILLMNNRLINNTKSI